MNALIYDMKHMWWGDMSHDVCVITYVSHIFHVTYQLTRFPPCLWPSSGFALCCSVLQCAAVCCPAVHYVALCCTFCACPSVSLALIMRCTALHCVARWYIVLHCVHILCLCLRVSGPYLLLHCVALWCAVVRCILYSVRASPCLWSQSGVMLCSVFVAYPSVLATSFSCCSVMRILSFTSLSLCIFLYFALSIPASSISPLALSHCPYFVPSLLHSRSLV